MINQLLDFLHRKRFYLPLTWLGQMMYFIKGFGYVRSDYHPSFRAYERTVNNIVFLNPGPGWALSVDFLQKSLEATHNFQYMPKKGDCVLDLGAGLGEESILYAILVGPTGMVHAFEANPSSYKGLKYVCERNKFNWVKTHHVAIYKEDCEVSIEDNEDNYLTNTIHVQGSEKASKMVQGKALDSIILENGIKTVDFLKSNIEGAEQFLIQGMNKSVGKIRYLSISCHDFRHTYHGHGKFYVTKEKVRAFLESNNFEITERTTGNPAIDDYIYARNKLLN